MRNWECHVAKRVTPASGAKASSARTSATVAPGGFSSSTCPPPPGSPRLPRRNAPAAAGRARRPSHPAGVEQFAERGKGLDPFDAAAAADGGRKRECGIARYGRDDAGPLAILPTPTIAMPIGAMSSVAVTRHRLSAPALQEVEVRAGVGSVDIAWQKAWHSRFRAPGPSASKRRGARRFFSVRHIEMQTSRVASTSIMSPSRTMARGPPTAASGETCSRTVPYAVPDIRASEMRTNVGDALAQHLGLQAPCFRPHAMPG